MGHQTAAIDSTSAEGLSPGDDSTESIRRRLGNWTAPATAQTSQMSPEPARTVDLGVGVDETAPLPAPVASAMGTVQSLRASLTESAATAPIGNQQSVPFGPTVAAELQQTTQMTGGDGDTITHSPSPLVPTISLSGHTATGALTSPLSPGGTAGSDLQTVPFAATAPTVAATAQMIGATSPMATAGESTVPLVGDYTAVIGEETDEIQSLLARVEDTPDDADLVFELALALNEKGFRQEAQLHLTRLVDLYERQGDRDQASRVRTMIGDAQTAEIAASAGQTEPVGRQTTDSLGNRRTGTLGLRSAPAGRDGRVANKPIAEERERPVFPLREIQFLDTAHRIERLSAEAAAFFDAAEEERRAGRYRSALDLVQMTVVADPGAPFTFLRMAELQLKLGYRLKALTTVNDLQEFGSLFQSEIPHWAFARIRLHAEPFELGKVQRLVDGLIAEGNAAIAAPYAARLIEHLDRDGRSDEAQAYSDRICALAPGDTRATLEGVLLCIKHGDRGGALDRWEFALRNGADMAVAKASLAAIVADHNESDHWRMLSEVMPVYRQNGDETIAAAYRRSAEACGESAVHKAAMSLFAGSVVAGNAKVVLAAAVGDRTGTATGRALAAGAMVRLLAKGDRSSEYLAAVRTTLTLFANGQAASDVNWDGLLGYVPRVEDMSYELGRELLKAGDAAGAVEVLKQGYAVAKGHEGLAQALADALARTSQHGSALTILDELAMSQRKAGRLEEMAGTLRQMSQLAPTNIKVKSRLVDAYLQRGFVAEARAELVQRADLEERAGKTADAIVSLQRAADLSWTLGFPQESFNLYDRILALDAEDVGNRSALVNLYLQVGRLSEAAEHQRVVVDIALRNGRKHEAIAALHQVIGLTPDDMTAYYQLGEALSTMGEYHQAEKVYRRIVLMNPDDAVAQAKATAMAALKEQANGE